MIARIKALFATFGASEPVASEAAGVDELHLAAAALLAEAAFGDDRFDDVERAAIDRLLREHVELRALVAKAEAAAKSELTPKDLPLFGQLGLALTDHIRWEERTLFNYVQDHTDDAGLERLRGAIAAMKHSRPKSKTRGPQSA